jgi:hypothetical protein
MSSIKKIERQLMKGKTVVLFLALTVLAQGQQATRKQCKDSLAKWGPLFKSAYSDAACLGDGTPDCPFVAPVRNLRTADLSDIAFQAEVCTKVDEKNRYLYQRVATRAENYIVMRAGNFLKDVGQSDQYSEWEQRKIKNLDAQNESEQSANSK